MHQVRAPVSARARHDAAGQIGSASAAFARAARATRASTTFGSCKSMLAFLFSAGPCSLTGRFRTHAQLDGYRQGLAVAEYFHADLVTGFVGFEFPEQLLAARHRHRSEF